MPAVFRQQDKSTADAYELWRRLRAGSNAANAAPSLPVTVQIALTPTTLSLSAGLPTATVTGVAGDLTNTPTGQTVFYYSSDTGVATVNRTSGLVTRVAAGSAIIYALLT